MGIWEKLGFSKGEGAVYEAVLDSENATLQDLHEKTGIERRNVYDIINKLISKGLVSYFTENGHKVYRANHPKHLVEYFEGQEEGIREKKKIIEGHMQSLLSEYESSKPEFDVRIYRGKEGIKALFNEALGHKHHYFIGGNWGVIKYIGKDWWELWNRKREKEKIWWHDIITSELLSNEKQELKFYEKKVLPREFGSPNVIFIFGDKVANLYWAKSLFAFTIENEEIRRNYISYFNYFWKGL